MISKDELERLYFKEDLSALHISKILGVSNVTVSNWLRKYNIEPKTVSATTIKNNKKRNKFPILNDKEWLYDQRVNKQLSYDAIAELVGCSVIPVKRAIKKYKIPLIRYNESNALTNSFLRNKNWLKEQHIDNKRTLLDIAEEIGSTVPTLSRFLSYHNIVANNTNIYPRKITRNSKEQAELSDYIKTITHDVIINDRKLLEGAEIDILLPSFRLAIEYNGNFYHSYQPEQSNENLRKGRNYHLNKTKKIEEQGYELIHIWSDDWKFRQDIVKSIISSKLNNNKRIYARKCKIQIINKSQKNSFLRENHIQGNDHSSVDIGLFFDQNLYAVMTFCKSRYNKKYSWELSRFCSKKYINIVGGFSKLLDYFVSIYGTSIISYADRSRSNGNVYHKNGFKLIKINPPSYYYIDLRKNEQRLHRSQFTKSKITNKEDTRTEEQIMFDRGYKKIFDCGTMVFALE